MGELSPTCKEAARLQSATLDGKLAVLKRAGLRVHLVFCQRCRRYGNQIAFLRSAARLSAQDDPQSPAQALSSQARQRIKETLQSARD